MAKHDVEFDYFHGYESEQFAFYRIPKVLLPDDYFKDLSSDAKVLYGLMLDRMSLSIKNNWIDDEDRVYIIFTLEQVMQYMNCGRDKGMKTLAELDTKKGIGLIERVKQGFGKPDVIYVKSFLIKENAASEQEAEDTKSLESSEQMDQVGNNNLSWSEKPTSRGRKNRLLEVGKSDSNYTNINKNNRSNTDLINPSVEVQGNRTEDRMDAMDVIQAYTDIVKNNIDYDILIQGCRTGDREYIDEIVELLVETISIDRETVMISGAEYPYQFVKNKLLKVNYSHIQYVLECLHDTPTKVRNVKAYLLTCLFNAPSTIGNYYRAEVGIDYWKLLFLMGIPFGVQKMFVWLILSGYGIGETVGIFALNLLVGGIIGGFIRVWRLLEAVFILAKGLVSGVTRMTGVCR